MKAQVQKDQNNLPNVEASIKQKRGKENDNQNSSLRKI